MNCGGADCIEPLSADHADALQEVVNVAMGQAGDRLARLFDHYVELSVPKIHLVDIKCLRAALREMGVAENIVTVVRQSFFNRIRGEAIVLFESSGLTDLAQLVDPGVQSDADPEHELLLDLSNIVVGACIGGIAEQLGTDLAYAAPSLLARDVRLDTVLAPSNLTWRYSLVVKIRFALEHRAFSCEILMFMPEESITLVRQALQAFLDTLE